MWESGELTCLTLVPSLLHSMQVLQNFKTLSFLNQSINQSITCILMIAVTLHNRNHVKEILGNFKDLAKVGLAVLKKITIF